MRPGTNKWPPDGINTPEIFTASNEDPPFFLIVLLIVVFLYVFLVYFLEELVPDGLTYPDGLDPLDDGFTYPDGFEPLDVLVPLDDGFTYPANEFSIWKLIVMDNKRQIIILWFILIWK